MTAFLNEDFLLKSETARELFHSYAEEAPIFDYHCHLPPKQVAENKNFPNLTDIWLRGDHYKWRLMRAAGVDEKFITGNATDEEKFYAWAETVPKTIGNPIYHWTHLELQRYFGFFDVLKPSLPKRSGRERTTCSKAWISRPERSWRNSKSRSSAPPTTRRTISPAINR